MAKVIYVANDGTQFENKPDADFHDMKPIVMEHLAELGEFTDSVKAFVINNKNAIVEAFNFGVTKLELDTLGAELKLVKEAFTTTGTTTTPFMVANGDEIRRAFKSLRKKFSDSDKVRIAIERLMTAGADEPTARTVTQFQEQVLAAYKAASPRANVSPKVTEQLVAQQERVRIERAEDERQAEHRDMTYKQYKIDLYLTATDAELSVADLRELRSDELGETATES